MKFVTVILLSAACLSGIIANAQVADTIPWQSKQTLSWTDYKGLPDEQSHFTALTHAEIKYKVTVYKTLARFEFVTLFMKKSSWTKTKRDAVLLEHEQIHFNIAELHKRKMMEILSTEKFSYNGFEATIKSIGDSINLLRHRMDNAFDADVANMYDNILVNKWKKDIEEALDKLRLYDRNNIFISFK